MYNETQVPEELLFLLVPLCCVTALLKQDWDSWVSTLKHEDTLMWSGKGRVFLFSRAPPFPLAHKKQKQNKKKNHHGCSSREVKTNKTDWLSVRSSKHPLYENKMGKAGTDRLWSSIQPLCSSCCDLENFLCSLQQGWGPWLSQGRVQESVQIHETEGKRMGQTNGTGSVLSPRERKTVFSLCNNILRVILRKTSWWLVWIILT